MIEKEKEAELLKTAINAAKFGGEEIMKIYAQEFEVFNKEDNSPLTIADQNANKVIEKLLKETNIPILSEEGKHADYNERKNWKQLWIVDPLDGTKEFVKRNGEFTVNIALVENGVPIMGVIYVPVKNWLYYGYSNGAFKTVDGKTEELPIKTTRTSMVVVGSRSHPSVETAQYFDELKKKHGQIEIVSMGSSLKICLVAEGKADIYPRFAPTMEWDTAAGHAIVNYAGKTLLDVGTSQEMIYNRKQLRNNWFIVK
ncbi:MAG: 3'(2'),5'-bisphosphate nucleotidase [Crocinitomicaceae bacterium]|nr:3'(2'),5'-bisphosphate nucleotidase [Crocinitomicaceae bacterium]|tara:strand:+ start:19082 stop:19849 length:768 start_codon:yes stop_codon:yes gene_type:complete